MQRVTLLDVASALGVSSITVSRALREPEKVSSTLRDRILRQVEDMGYVPDLAARALASRHNGIIGVLTPALTDLAFIGIMAGIEERVRSSDLRIQYANSHYDSDMEFRQLQLFLSQHPAGIVLTSLQKEQRVVDLLSGVPCPVVQIVDIELVTVGISLGISHREASATAVRHLLECGYSRVGMIAGRRSLRSQRRHEGYIMVMQEAGGYDPALVETEASVNSVELGCRLLRQLLQRVPDLDAVFCENDDLALGVLFECRRLGIRVPEDFGICGFNDLDFAACSEPGLTTVHVPRFELGYRAAELLIRAVANGGKRNHVEHMPFELIQRGSTRRVQ
ncbi:LacI family DNA-binding transcriptional regulator [Neorhizobium lilium]|nr:LacI family DNA-binding transcriptional regulator [Neorhizobium lilium]